MRQFLKISVIMFAFIVIGCDMYRPYMEDKIIFKNSTDREIDYVYDTVRLGRKFWTAHGEKIEYIAGTLAKQSRQELYGFGCVITVNKDRTPRYGFYLRIPTEDSKWLFIRGQIANLTRSKTEIEFEITDELIQQMQTEQSVLWYWDIKDSIYLTFADTVVLTDKTECANKLKQISARSVPYWDTWTEQGDFPNDWRTEAVRLWVYKVDENTGEISGDPFDPPREYFYFIYNDVVYGVNTTDGKRTRLGEVTEEEKTQRI